MAARTKEDICNMALLNAGANQKISSIGQLNNAAAQACKTYYDEIRRRLLNDQRWPFAKKRVLLNPLTGVVWSATGVYANLTRVLYGATVYTATRDVPVGTLPTDVGYWRQETRDGWAYVCPLPDDFISPVSIWEKPTASALNGPPLYSFPDPSNPNLRNPMASERVPCSLENSNDGEDNTVMLTDLDTPVLLYIADIENPNAFSQGFVETFAWHLAVPLAEGLRGDGAKATSCAKMAEVTLGKAWISNMRDQQEDVEPMSEFEAARLGRI